MDDVAHVVVTDASLEDGQQLDGEEMQVIEVAGGDVTQMSAEDDMRVIEVTAADIEEEEVTTSEVIDNNIAE